MDGIFRRSSGVYFARISVPKRLRARLARTEFIASLRVRELHQAKLVGAAVICAWRRLLHELDGRPPVDLLQVSVGSPLLGTSTLIPLRTAAAASGLSEDELLGLAAAGEIGLHVLPGRYAGFVIPLAELDRDAETGGYDVPIPAYMPATAVRTEAPGPLALWRQEQEVVVQGLRERKPMGSAVLLLMPGKPRVGFAPDPPMDLSKFELHVLPQEVEAQRQRLAALITPSQLEALHAVAPAAPTPSPTRKRRKASEAVAAYMDERGRQCSADQARRIRAACDLFVELSGDPWLDTVDRAALRNYRDHLLPTVPAHENKVRLMHGSTSITESSRKIEQLGLKWPSISQAERAKRMQWLSGMFEWLAQEKWIAEDISDGLATAIRAKTAKASHTRRDLFTADDLKKIFGAPWFQTGRGTLTRQGTYREFLPYYYWLPLLGLYFGARINEICQLALTDIKQTPAGTWYVDINEDDEAQERKVKNAQSVRAIPLHPHLTALGLLDWRKELLAHGHSRLFPELKHDPVKGYSKAAVKWFSCYLKRIGWPRDGRKVFHSFRHTLASACLNDLGLSEAVTAQISGHKRGQTVLGATYRKDLEIDRLAPTVAKLSFQLPQITMFDPSSGLDALHDALERKLNISAARRASMRRP